MIRCLVDTGATVSSISREKVKSAVVRKYGLEARGISGEKLRVRPQLHYTGLLFIPDCLNSIRYENIGSYTAPLRLFVRSVPGIHYIAHLHA